jgi:hypothetical protein
MSNIAEKIIEMIDDGMSIISISKFFGGMDNFSNIIDKYPNLKKIVINQLEGVIRYYYKLEMIDIPIVVTDFEDSSDDDTGFDHFNLIIDMMIPEITDLDTLSELYEFFDDFIMSMGPDAIILNNKSIVKGILYLPVLNKINGITWEELKNRNHKPIDDSDLLNIIPEKYIKNA